MTAQVLNVPQQESLGLAASPEDYVSHAARISELIAYKIEPSLMQSAFRSRMPFFFVKGDFSRLRARIDRIHRDLREAGFEPPTLPSKPDLAALSRHAPLSLFSILRICLVWKYVHANLPELAGKPHFAGANLIPPRSVIPSVRYVDPELIAPYCKDRERALVAKMNQFIESLTGVDRGEERRFPLNVFSSRLEKGEPLGRNRGGRVKHFRVSTACAMAICHAITGSSDWNSLREEADTFFPEDDKLGPGKGMYTIALAPSNGNQIYWYG